MEPTKTNNQRNFLRARRRCNSNNPSANTNTGNTGNRRRLSSGERSTPYEGGGQYKKNIASERLKRLRENLTNDLNRSHSNDSSMECPQNKRFKQNNHESESPHRRQSNESSVFKTPANNRMNALVNKSFSSPSTSSSSSVQNRLMSPLKRKTPPNNISYSPPNQLLLPNTSTPLKQQEVSVVLENEDLQFKEITNISSVSQSSLETHANNSDQSVMENMDWSPVNEESLLTDIRLLRQKLHEETVANQPFPSDNILELDHIESSFAGKLKKSNIYIVVDTNIFIDKLQTIINIMSISYKDNTFPIIYTPWMVIQELDYFKDGYSLSEKHPISKVIQTRCRKAVKFINDCLSAQKPNFKGQNVLRAAEDRTNSRNPDDSIIACCIQLTNEGNDVILLSSDVNLRNKAIICSISAKAPTEIVQVLKTRKVYQQKMSIIDAVSKKMSLILSFVVHFELKNFYGVEIYAMKNYKELPWSLEDCVNYIDQSYDCLFKTHLQKHSRKVIDDLREIFTSKEFTNEMKFVELCLSLLIYFQNGLPRYDSNIQNVIKEIKELENKYLS